MSEFGLRKPLWPLRKPPGRGCLTWKLKFLPEWSAAAAGEFRVGWKWFGAGDQGIHCRWKKWCSSYWQLRALPYVPRCQYNEREPFTQHTHSSKSLSLHLPFYSAKRSATTAHSFWDQESSPSAPSSPLMPYILPKAFCFSSSHWGDLTDISKTTRTFISIIAHLGYALEGGQWGARENLIYLLGWFIQAFLTFFYMWTHTTCT